MLHAANTRAGVLDLCPEGGYEGERERERVINKNKRRSMGGQKGKLLEDRVKEDWEEEKERERGGERRVRG